jgi:hypothetical protein
MATVGWVVRRFSDISAVNCAFMLASPIAWFRLPKWLGAHGRLLPQPSMLVAVAARSTDGAGLAVIGSQQFYRVRNGGL